MNFSSVDLHCHSTSSDGSLSPELLLQRASEKGVTHLALTDHDTISGLFEAHQAAKSHSVHLINGIELSCVWSNYTIHVLGLNFNLENGVIKAAEEQQTASRLERAKVISEKLIKKGLPDLFDAACAKAETGIPGRPHFAELMLDQGLVTSMDDAFKQYLGAGKIGDVKSFWPDLESVTKWIKEAGGSAVIAHPRKYDMTLTKLRNMLALFKEYGGDGLEVITSGQKQGEVGMLADLCQRMGFKASLGSDFHSPKYPWAELGRIPTLPDRVEPIWSGWGLAI